MNTKQFPCDVKTVSYLSVGYCLASGLNEFSEAVQATVSVFATVPSYASINPINTL